MQARVITTALAAALIVVGGCSRAGADSHGHEPEAHAAGGEGKEPRRPRPFTIDSRIEHLESIDYYPCNDCHDEQDPNPRIRPLVKEHDDIELDHGGERFWCLTCHHEEDRDQLVGMKGQTISFDQPHVLCGHCHSQAEKDWLAGAHGKRRGSWTGERRLTSCPECHNPHSPAFKVREPIPPPTVRAGLKHDTHAAHGSTPIWERVARKRKLPPAAASGVHAEVPEHEDAGDDDDEEER